MKYLIRTRRYGPRGPSGATDWRGKRLTGWTPWRTIATLDTYEGAESAFIEWSKRPENRIPMVDVAAVFYDGTPFAILANGTPVRGRHAVEFWSSRRT